MDENKIAAPTQTSNDRPLSTLKDSGWSFVAEVTELSDREFATYRDSMRPVILRGGCSAWKACQ
ncbi:MAG: hypothetical protein E5Y32_35445, partial [Mesorhizobium sp.]